MGRLVLPVLFVVVFAALWLEGKPLLVAAGFLTERQVAWALRFPIQVGLWLSGAWLLVRLFNMFVLDRLMARSLGHEVPSLLKDTIGFVFFVTAIAGLLGFAFDQSLSGLFAASGAIAIVLGFALRNVILDVFTGLAVNLDRSYEIGDWVELHSNNFKEPIFGKVIALSWRTTRILREDGVTIVLPNNVMSIMVMTNYTQASGAARFDLPVRLDFAVAQDRAKRVLLAAAASVAGSQGIKAHPAPQVLTNIASQEGVEYLVRYWVELDETTKAVARDRVATRIVDHLAHAGIEPARPLAEIRHAPLGETDVPLGSVDDRLRLIDRVDLFREGVGEDDRCTLAEAMDRRSVACGEAIVSQGDSGASMFVLAEGFAEVLVVAEGGTTPVRVGEIGPGDCFGEISLLTGENRAATVCAAVDSVVYEITKDHLRPLLDAHPKLAETLSGLCARRQLATTTRLARPDAQAEEEAQHLGQQILTRMRAFFRPAGQRGPSGRAAE